MPAMLAMYLGTELKKQYEPLDVSRCGPKYTQEGSNL
ncbi:hypothetical protein ETAA8_68520 [Anatilimnocola aggregata]|uniref:Uncharacterized protein n=1 Tax=Anatilimnocola aggregata TaxID=2528021 RepID=A0A517YN99_9BACT|nr:hypothetical protein ETAA8_68520 [Anatilimnocola aggregata]